LTQALPLAARRSFRLALAVGIATFAVHAAALPLGFMGVLMTAILLAPPGPPPGLAKGAVVIVALMAVSLLGLLLGPVLIYVPLAGVLLSLTGVALAAHLRFRPGGGALASLLIVGSTLIAVLAAQSSALAVAIAKTLILATMLALVVSQVLHAILPDGPAPPVQPAPDASAATWVGLRSAIIMLPPLIAALSNPTSYIMLLVKGSLLAQQTEATHTRHLALDTVTSTLAGGVMALTMWRVLQIWPNLIVFTLVMTLATLLVARPMYGAIRSRLAPDWWMAALVTMMILIGPAVNDSQSASDIQVVMLTRLATFIGLAIYAAVAVHILDGLRRSTPRSQAAG
jgi:hypothetical protein